ncbi:MAG: hypothetical protein RR400_02165 [Clostridia bacterium]
MILYRSRVAPRRARFFKIDYSSFASGMNSEVDENLMPNQFAKLSFNYISKSGALKTGIGFKGLKLPKSETSASDEREVFLPANVKILKAWHFKRYSNMYEQKEHCIVYYCDNKKLYFFKLISIDPNSFYVDSALEFKSVPNALNYKLNGNDVMIFTSPQDDLVVFDPTNGIKIVSTAPKIVSMCIHYERLFAIVEGERNEIRFSDDLDPTNWTISPTAGGFITFADGLGRLSKVVSFADYVYVIREYGISRISAYGDQNDFSVSNVFSSSGKIYGESAQVCGNKILFLSKSGIHVFDGISARKIELNLDSLFDGVRNDFACSAYFDNKYYIALKLEFNDGEKIGCEIGDFKNNALLEYDLSNGAINILRGVDISSLSGVEEGIVSKLIATFGSQFCGKIGELTKDGCVFGAPLKKVWKSPFSNLGYPSSKKIVKEIEICSKFDCKVKVKTDKTEKIFCLTGKDRANVVRPNLNFEKIEVSFMTDGADADISSPTMKIGVFS